MNHPVPLTALGAEADEVWQDVAEPLKAAVSAASFIGGPIVERFEEEWARFCGVPHAVGVANGTDALCLTLRALGVGPGDEVLVPASTFVATAEAVVLAGASPRFVDVDPRTLLMTTGSILGSLSSRTRGVIAVHLYGQPCDMEELSRTVSQRGLFLVEDAAQAHGASWNGRPVGSFGDAGCFSFYPSKNLGAFGDGGAVVTRDASLARMVRSLGDHGRATGSHHNHVVIGTNSRLDCLQGLVLNAKLARLPAWIEARRQAAARYQEGLRGVPGVELLDEQPLAAHAYNLFVVRVADRERVRAELSSYGVATGVHYPRPCHKEVAFERFAREPLPEAEAAANEVLSLPLHPYISQAEVDRVVESLRSAVGEKVGAGVPVL